MTVKTGQVWTGNFDTLDATGALAVPSVGPVGTLYVAGVATADAVTISGGAPYKFSVTLPALTAGQSVGMRITATIATIATASVVAEEVADTYLISDIESLVDDIGTAGAGLTAIPWNAAWDAEVQSEVEDALGAVTVDVGKISGDSAAADALETMLDGTGGNKLTLSQLKIVAAGNDAAIDAAGSGTGHGIIAQGGANNAVGIYGYGQGSAAGILGSGSGAGGSGIMGTGNGSGAGMKLIPGVTGIALETSKLVGTHLTPAAVAEIQNGLATPTNITAGTITTVTNLTNAATNGDLTATMKTSVQTAATASLNAYDPPTNAEMEARTIAAASYALEATLTAIKGAGWTIETLKAIYDQVLLRLATGSYTAPDNASVALIKDVTDKIATALELDGAVYRYTANALEMAPAGGAGLTAQDVRDAMKLAPTAGASAAGSVDTHLDAIQAKTDLITADTEITVTNAVVGSTITIRRGDTLAAIVTGLGSLAGYVSIDFAVKEDYDDDDDDALIWIRKNASGLSDGLLYLNGAVATDATDGSIAIDDEGAGDITINLAADVSKLLPQEMCMYEIQIITATSVRTLQAGGCQIVRDVIKAVV